MKREKLTTISEIIGCLMVIAGVAFIWLPLSLIVAGVILIGISGLAS